MAPGAGPSARRPEICARTSSIAARIPATAAASSGRMASLFARTATRVRRRATYARPMQTARRSVAVPQRRCASGGAAAAARRAQNLARPVRSHGLDPPARRADLSGAQRCRLVRRSARVKPLGTHTSASPKRDSRGRAHERRLGGQYFSRGTSSASSCERALTPALRCNVSFVELAPIPSPSVAL